MKLQLQSYYNPWFVENKEVDKIVIFAHGEVVMEVQRKWLEVMGDSIYSSKPIGSIGEVEEVKLRRAVDLNRQEHFYTTKDRVITVYLNAGILPGMESPKEIVYMDLETEKHYIMAMRLLISVNGAEQNWVMINAGRTHRTELKPLGELVEEFKTEYNKTVPDHTNRDISTAQALRLIKAFPALAAIISKHDTQLRLYKL